MNSVVETSDIDCCDLAAHLLKISDNEDDGEVWKIFEDVYGIEQNNFIMLIKDLIPLITIGKSPLTGVIYKGFAEKVPNTDLFVWFAKIEMKFHTEVQNAL